MSTRRIAPVLLVSAIDALGFSVVLPFLVFVVHDFGGDAVVYGALAATYPACQLIASPILGHWSDAMGRRPVMLISEIGVAIGWALFAGAMIMPAHGGVPLALLFIGRGVAGLTGGNVSVANAYVADVTPENERSSAFGSMGVAASLGFVIGPAIAGLLGKHYLVAVLGAFALSLTAALVVAVRLPESLPCVLRKHPNRAQPAVVFGIEPRPCVNIDSKRSRLRDTLRVARVPGLLVFYFVAYLGFTMFQAAFPSHAATTLHWSVRQTGFLFTVLSGTLALVQGLATGRLAKKLGNKPLIASGSAILAIGLVLFASSSTLHVYAAAVLYAIGTGLMWPPLLAVIANVAGSEHQGAVQGLAGTAGGIASMLGLLLGGVLYHSSGSATFLIASAMLMACAVMSLAMRSSAKA